MDIDLQTLAGGLDLDRFLNSESAAILLLLFTLGVVLVTFIVARQWRAVRIAEAEVSLKLKMLERGYSADEIVKVLQAGVPPWHFKRRHGSTAENGCCTSDFVRGGASR
ncbi:MAG: hypothetical protein PVI86_11495 [Phycisphaerae bacterium]|jgi:hypothetical protein